jgi:uncharacterized lipoprotein NlpE involved in copper resistance
VISLHKDRQMAKVTTAIIVLLALAGCAARSTPRRVYRFDFRNIKLREDGSGTCEIATTATDAKTHSTVVFCK